jgi:putative ABC transport system permease protein
MLVSVTERTREIGICMALGAQRGDIMAQFLVESAILSLSGGLIGLVLGYGVGIGVSYMIPDFPTAFVPFWAIALAIGSSTLIGLIFGVAPAAKAAHLDPIVALRHE